MPTYAELNQKHPSIDMDEMVDHEALYRGGKKFKERLGVFLPQWDCEPNKRYAIRKKLAYYRNYLGAVVDYFTALLFTGKATAAAKTLEGEKEVKDPDPYYGKFRSDCDGNGQDLELFFKERLTEAMCHRISWFVLRHPQDDAASPAQSLAEYRKRAIGDCTLKEIPVGEVFDWECDDEGNLELVIVHSKTSKRGSVSGGRSKVSERWTVYLPDRVDVYGLDYETTNPPATDADVPLKPKEGYQHRFGCVPVLCLELKTALWAANKLADPQLAHFRASNAQSWSLQNSAFAMMLFTVGDPGEFAKVDIGAGRGIVLRAPDEDAKWISPPGEHFAALDTDIKSQKDEIFRLAHQMALGVENNAAALGRSAESKASDSEATRVILEAYGEAVVEAMERVYDMISVVRGDKYSWSVEGLGDFASADVGGLLTTLEQVDKIGGIPSTTWKTKVLTRVATTTAPDVTEDDKVKIAKEIQESLEAAEEHALAMKEAQLDGIGEDPEDPEGAVGGGARGNRPPPPVRGQAAAAG